MKFVIVTGMSGAGKSTAMKMMEDMGYFCIDNLPIQLLDKLIDFSNTLPSLTLPTFKLYTRRRGETILSQAVSASIRASCLRGKSCSI